VAEWHSTDDPNNRDKINRARQAAEELFKPTQPSAERDVSAPVGNNSGPVDQDQRRQPRIFAMPPRVPVSAEAKIPTEAKPAPRPAIPRRRRAVVPPSQFGRIRTLATYGMTQEQVADLYGATVDEIARILDYPLGSGTSK
jgi:hypothetical protein